MDFTSRGAEPAQCGARPVRNYCVRHRIPLSAPSGSKCVTTGVGVRQVGSGRPFRCLSKRIRKEQPDELPPSSVQTGQATFSDTSRSGRRGRGGGGPPPPPPTPSPGPPGGGPTPPEKQRAPTKR